MRIAFLLRSTSSITSVGDGVRVQADNLARELTRMGHNIIKLTPWEYTDLDRCDILQAFIGGLDLFQLYDHAANSNLTVSYAPINDNNYPFWMHRVMNRLGILTRRFYTVPGEIYRQCLASNIIIVPSLYARDRMIRAYGIPPEKISVVHNGVNTPRRPNPRKALRRYRLPSHFALHISNYTDPRKNVPRLLKAFRSIDLPLVIAGKGFNNRTLRIVSGMIEAMPNVSLIGDVTESDKYALYHACDLFCLPSLNEGTGLAALEAGSCGAKVVITDQGGTKDYFGDHACYVDPYSVQSIRQGIIQTASQTNTHFLRDFILTNYSWKRSAEVLYKVYRDYMRSHPK